MRSAIRNEGSVPRWTRIQIACREHFRSFAASATVTQGTPLTWRVRVGVGTAWGFGIDRYDRLMLSVCQPVLPNPCQPEKIGMIPQGLAVPLREVRERMGWALGDSRSRV